jgi:hypothetical protein
MIGQAETPLVEPLSPGGGEVAQRTIQRRVLALTSPASALAVFHEVAARALALAANPNGASLVTEPNTKGERLEGHVFSSSQPNLSARKPETLSPN